MESKEQYLDTDSSFPGLTDEELDNLNDTSSKVESQDGPPSLPRKERRKSQQHMLELSQLLANFYRHISRNQLKDEDLKSAFTKYNSMWGKYCAKKKLNGDAKPLFALQVQAIWQKKMEKLEENPEA